jgi:hypothetical protein
MRPTLFIHKVSVHMQRYTLEQLDKNYDACLMIEDRNSDAYDLTATAEMFITGCGYVNYDLRKGLEMIAYSRYPIENKHFTEQEVIAEIVRRLGLRKIKIV